MQRERDSMATSGGRTWARAGVMALGLLLVLAGPARAQSARAELKLESREAYVGLPFVLAMTVEDFAESPTPTVPSLVISGARVSPLGASPNTMRSVRIINGRREDSSQTTWALRWRVEVDRAGTLSVPELTVSQGNLRASTPAARLEVRDLPVSQDMKLELGLPARPVWVGETVPVELTWLLRRSPADQTFAVPLFSAPEVVVTAPPASNPRQVLAFAAGGRDLNLPYQQDEIEQGGVRTSRFRFAALITPTRAGTLTIAPSTVAASLEVGRRDFFGNAPTRMFRSADVARTLEVKALPQSGRPPGFAGAVGAAYGIAVQASRSVVQLGEPVELTISITSSERLDALALPRLDGPGGLPPAAFRVPADAPTGELADDGKRKTFTVSVQVVGAATEIPALTLAYFDPTSATYQTAQSEPIALSVKGGALVGAGDVVGAAPRAGGAGGSAAPAAGGAPAEVSLVGADLALSAPSDALRTPLGGGWVWIVVGLLYLVPALLVGSRWLAVRTRSARAEAGEVRAARQRALAAAARARTAPAREAAGELADAVRALHRAVGAAPATGAALLARVETEGFAPTGASAPLPAALVGEVEVLIEAARVRPAAKGAGAAVSLLVGGGLLVGAAGPARAEPLADGRAEYQEAMNRTEPAARRAAFARAADALAQAAAAHPRASELLTDWGNAALGAGDVATATLAYRRALAAEPGNRRAQRNLSWLRSKQDPSLRVAGADAADTLFFFHRWPRAWRWLLGAGAFALVLLLVAPWGGAGRRGLRALAIGPLLVWVGMVGSLLLERRGDAGAVVVDSIVVRAADSIGAPAALTQPLPPGTEVDLVEARAGWRRIRLGNGTTGWVPDGALVVVADR
jgi:hypothetical protein